MISLSQKVKYDTDVYTKMQGYVSAVVDFLAAPSQGIM